jgi:DHA1 family multidrug resistance protein-like MFS transporter
MLGWLIFEPLSGVIADRINKKYLLIYAIIGSSIIYALYPSAAQFSQFAALGFLLTSIMSAYAISVKSFTAELLPKNKRGRVYGRYTAIITAGGILGPVLGGFITNRISEKTPFYIASVLGIFSLIGVLLMRYDNKVKDINIKEKSKPDQNLWSNQFVSILMVRSLFMFNLVFRLYNLQIFLHENQSFRLSVTEIGLFMSIVLVTSALSQSFFGELTDKIGSKKVIIGSVGFLGLSYLALGLTSGKIPLMIIAVIQGLSIAAADLSMMLQLMEIMPYTKTGMVMGLYSESENIGGMIASPSLGYIYDIYGPSSSVFSVAGILIFNAFLSWKIIHNRSIIGKTSN